MSSGRGSKGEEIYFSSCSNVCSRLNLFDFCESDVNLIYILLLCIFDNIRISILFLRANC